MNTVKATKIIINKHRCDKLFVFTINKNIKKINIKSSISKKIKSFAPTRTGNIINEAGSVAIWVQKSDRINLK